MHRGKSSKKCFFCRSDLGGKVSNFEHVISDWLVREADLKWRTMPFEKSSKIMKIAMNRIGGKACSACNSRGGLLEIRAKNSYYKIANGTPLNCEDKLNLLDWMDKIRTGLWLWLLDVTREENLAYARYGIDGAIASKDRLLLICKCNNTEKPKGLSFWGLDQFFAVNPIAIGIFINNIVIVSFASNLSLFRHNVNFDVRRTVLGNGSETFELLGDEKARPGVTLMPAGAIFGQVIAPGDFLAEAEIEQISCSGREGFSSSRVLNLDNNLKLLDDSDVIIPETKGIVTNNLDIMNLNMRILKKYYISDMLSSIYQNQMDAFGYMELQKSAVVENYFNDLMIQHLRSRIVSNGG